MEYGLWLCFFKKNRNLTSPKIWKNKSKLKSGKKIIPFGLVMVIYSLNYHGTGLGKCTGSEYHRRSQFRSLQTRGTCKTNYCQVQFSYSSWFHWSWSNGIWHGNASAEIKFHCYWLWCNRSLFSLLILPIPCDVLYSSSFLSWFYLLRLNFCVFCAEIVNSLVKQFDVKICISGVGQFLHWCYGYYIKIK